MRAKLSFAAAFLGHEAAGGAVLVAAAAALLISNSPLAYDDDGAEVVEDRQREQERLERVGNAVAHQGEYADGR